MSRKKKNKTDKTQTDELVIIRKKKSPKKPTTGGERDRDGIGKRQGVRGGGVGWAKKGGNRPFGAEVKKKKNCPQAYRKLGNATLETKRGRKK